MQEHSRFPLSNTRYVDDKPMNMPGDLDMSESLCLKGPTGNIWYLRLSPGALISTAV